MWRLFDILFAASWLVATLPLMVMIAICIRCESAGPVLYTPAMVGLHGRLFPLLRFRTMRAGRHPRLTRVGRVIRACSLDHLPMLLNVLLGDLAVVGPRPIEPARVDLRDPNWQAYFSVKPGLFNYAVLKLGNQWTSRQASQPAQNQQLELSYLRRRTWRLDLAILLRSMAALVRSRGNIKERKLPDSDVEQ
jgi:lipopolysaccharide/colanic/teichoic acid biosynthesis glycosyltransferase